LLCDNPYGEGAAFVRNATRPKTAKDVTAMVKQAVETVVALMKGFRSRGGSDGNIGTSSKPKTGDNVSTVLLVGMEGTGKTQLIKSCFGHPTANSTVETEDFKVYTSRREVDGKKCWLNVADYMGQNIGMLVSAFIDSQRVALSPLQYGQVNGLILMVDLRRPEKDRRLDPRSRPTCDTKRVKENLEQWNSMAVDALFGLLTEPALRYVCLFINKYDLISQPERFPKSRAQSCYAALVEYLRLKVKPVKAGGTIKVDVIVGSAKHGDGHSELIENLLRHSVPVR